MKEPKNNTNKTTICQSCKEMVVLKQLHKCPYQSEINEYDEPYCNCCEECEHECAMDI